MSAFQTPNHFNRGLTEAQVLEQTKKFGLNEIKSKTEYTALKILLSQFTSFLVIVLLIAGCLSIILQEFKNGIAIFVIVFINAIIGFFQEYKAENAVKALKKLVIPKAIVIRDGEQKEIEITELVPDDIVILSEGDKIPADLKILESFSLKVDESILTGESVSVSKKAPTSNKEEKDSLLYKGSLITTGRAKAIVLHTGANTEFGKIVDLVSQQTKTKSPLTVQMDELGKKLGYIVLVLVVLLFGLGILKQIPLFDMLMTSVALGVSAIPEGMPIIVTLTLTLGVQTMARKNAIIRKMTAIETLGATTIICSDKTGTLTLNQMTVKKYFTNNKEKVIPGEGYSLEDKFQAESPEEKKLLAISENCNNAFVEKSIIGDPTEIALKILAKKSNHKQNLEKVDELTFTSERKMMSTLHKTKNGLEIFAKGALEEILKKCNRIMIKGKAEPLDDAQKADLEKQAKLYSEKAFRVLGMAYKPINTRSEYEEKNLIFVGLVGMLDPPRKTVKESLNLARSAGIKIKIITGDNPVTAKAVGEEVGMSIHKVVTGDEIDQMSDEELIKVINETEIFARTKPQHKYRIVDLLKKNNEVVAVTGDGVNDAPALKHADVGIAMGITGTEATKEVADIVLKDDNFSTIINTVEEGRRIYSNILAFIKYMLSANFITLMAVALITLMGYPLPILALQVLWLNIATDALPALALGNSKAAENTMDMPPHPKHENIVKKFFSFIIIAAIMQTIANLIIYFYGYSLDQAAAVNVSDLDIPSKARTLLFTQTVLFELFFAFVCKDEQIISFKKLTSNKWLIGAVAVSFLMQLIILYVPAMQDIFKTTPLTALEWLLITLLASNAFFVPTVSNFIKKQFNRVAHDSLRP